MNVYLGTDHTGIHIKDEVKTYLEENGYHVEDCGAYEYDRNDDYPDFIGKAAQKVSGDSDSVGFVFGGSGQGEQMTANKYKGVRCALFYAPARAVSAIDISGSTSDDPFEIIKLTRQHNHSNMLSFGVRFLNKETVIKAVETFLNTPYSDDERHVRRIKKMMSVEK